MPEQPLSKPKLPPVVPPGAQEVEPVNNLEVYKHDPSKQVGSPTVDKFEQTESDHIIKE